jgi:hypothetical protein
MQIIYDFGAFVISNATPKRANAFASANVMCDGERSNETDRRVLARFRIANCGKS